MDASEYSQSVDKLPPQSYHLKLYITGSNPASVKAVVNMKKICENYLADRYLLEVIDIYQQPHLASNEQILAVPTLVRVSPLPAKRLIGEMSNTGRVLRGLDLKPKSSTDDSI